MTAPDLPNSRWPSSPVWTPIVRLWVLTGFLVMLAFVWWSVRQFTTIVVSAVLLAYLLDPVIRWTRCRFRVRRSVATLVVYVLVALALVLVGIALAPVMARGVMAVDLGEWQSATAAFIASLPRDVVLLDHRFDLAPVLDTLQGQFRSLGALVLGRDSIVWLLGFATDFAFTLLGLFFTLVLSIYLAMDADRTMAWIERKIPPGYISAYHAVRRDIGDVWQAFFRGQLVLVGVIAVSTTLGLLALGVSYALWLGLIAGALEVVPRVGPTLSLVPAIVIAVARPSSVLPDLPRHWFVLLVVLLYILIQQAENNILVPRIIGARVNLPPAAVLVGALMGAALAGILGILLAPPVIGSARVAGSWLFSKVAGDGEPFDDDPHDTAAHRTDGPGSTREAGADRALAPADDPPARRPPCTGAAAPPVRHRAPVAQAPCQRTPACRHPRLGAQPL